MLQIDAHQHFWNYSALEYPWLGTGMEHLRRDFLPEDLLPLLTANRLTHAVAVQARQSLAETARLLELADTCPQIYAVVGWVDLRSPELVQQLTTFAAHPKFVGVRHVAQDEPDDNFLRRPEVVQGIARLADFGLTYDILIYPRQLPAAIELVKQLPGQPFVLDHLAKPQIRDQQREPWTTLIQELARQDNVVCKVSGMVTEAAWRQWQPADFEPYLDVVFQAFGPERLMFGSDWPVCRAAAEFDDVVELVRDYVQRHCPESENRIFGGTAAEFYQRR